MAASAANSWTGSFATSLERLTLAWLRGLIRTTQRLPRWVLGPLQAGQHGGREGETTLVASLQKTLQGIPEKRNGVSPSARNWEGGTLHQHHTPPGKEVSRRVPASQGAVHIGQAKILPTINISKLLDHFHNLVYVNMGVPPDFPSRRGKARPPNQARQSASLKGSRHPSARRTWQRGLNRDNFRAGTVFESSPARAPTPAKVSNSGGASRVPPRSPTVCK